MMQEMQPSSRKAWPYPKVSCGMCGQNAVPSEVKYALVVATVWQVNICTSEDAAMAHYGILVEQQKTEELELRRAAEESASKN